MSNLNTDCICAYGQAAYCMVHRPKARLTPDATRIAALEAENAKLKKYCLDYQEFRRIDGNEYAALEAERDQLAAALGEARYVLDSLVNCWCDSEIQPCARCAALRRIDALAPGGQAEQRAEEDARAAGARWIPRKDALAKGGEGMKHG